MKTSKEIKMQIEKLQLKLNCASLSDVSFSSVDVIDNLISSWDDSEAIKAAKETLEREQYYEWTSWLREKTFSKKDVIHKAISLLRDKLVIAQALEIV